MEIEKEAIYTFLKFRIDSKLKIEFQTMVHILQLRRYTIYVFFSLNFTRLRYVEPFGLFLALQCGQSSLYNCNK